MHAFMIQIWTWLWAHPLAGGLVAVVVALPLETAPADAEAGARHHGAGGAGLSRFGYRELHHGQRRGQGPDDREGAVGSRFGRSAEADRGSPPSRG